MIKVYYTKRNTPFVWASDLHAELAISIPLSKWFPSMAEFGFIDRVDYFQEERFIPLSNGSEKSLFDWVVRIEMASHIAMIQRSERGKALRDHLINLDKRVQEGALLNHIQIGVLFEIVKVLGFFTIQSFFENEHFILKDKPNTWWNDRAKLLGYSAKDLKDIVEALGKKYKSQRQALMQFDKYELIRMAIMDMFIAMGKSEDYAKNIADFAKTIAKEIKPEIYDDTNTPIDFKTPEQKKLLQELKNYKAQTKLLDTF